MHKKLLIILPLLILICAPSCRKKSKSEKYSEKMEKRSQKMKKHLQN